MKNVKVRNMTTNGGNTAPNQFIITTKEGDYLQSYDSVIAFVPNDRNKKIILGNDWDYSNTTRRYLYKFLGYPYTCKKDILKGIEAGYLIEKDLD